MIEAGVSHSAAMLVIASLKPDGCGQRRRMRQLLPGIGPRGTRIVPCDDASGSVRCPILPRLIAWVFLIASAGVTGAAEVAAPADGGEGSFLDSFGINMQLDRSDHAARKQMLLELGIRHNRCTTGVQGVSTVDATILGRITDLAASGVKATLLWSRWSSLTEMVATTASLGSAVVAVEGPNETNLAAENFTYNGSGFPVGSRAIQRDMYAAFKADGRVRSLPVYLTTVAPTLSYADLGDMETYGGSRNMDFGNMHCYYVVSHLLGDKLETYHIANARLAAPTLPLVCTETGFRTSEVSESAQAKYALRAFCEGFRRQVRRTYWFALVDDPNGLFGLLRADLTRKPSFTALRDLIAMLRDPGGSAPYPLGSLALTFANAPASLRHLLLRDSSGTWSIIVWNEVLSYDNGADLVVAPVPVVVGVGASFAQVTVHRPMQGTAAVASAAGVNQIAVDVPDHPLVIRLRPATAPAIATSPANQTVVAPATATFTVAASGVPTPTFHWQSAPSGSSTFAGISGATSVSYTTAATSTGMSGVKYRCVATNSAGSATSAVAVLTVLRRRR